MRHAIDTANAALRTALLAGDAVKVADLYTVDAQIVAPGAPIAAGRAAIVEFWKGFIASKPKDLSLTTRSVESAGELTVEDGTVKITGADGSVSTARYLVVWKKEDGSLKLHRDIWNAQ